MNLKDDISYTKLMDKYPTEMTFVYVSVHTLVC